MTTPEQRAREGIDALLTAAGWTVQDPASFNRNAAEGVAVREFALPSGPCDYLLFVDGKAAGVIEAKKAGVTLSGVAEQAARYMAALPQHLARWGDALVFDYESTGTETYFCDTRDPRKRSHLCSTCPIPTATDDRTVRGGAGASAALYTAGDVGWGVGANAAFDAGGLPSLGVFSFAETVGLPGGGANFYNAFASAKGLQRFDYLGSAPTTYTISFIVEGRFTLGTSDPGSPVEIFGGFSVFGSGFIPGQEVQPVLASKFVSQHASSGGVAPFSLPGSLSFTINPGDYFYVQGQMVANSVTNIAHQTNGTVDALHTLAGSFTAGDTSLLAAAVTAVPEASALPMWAAGLLAMAWQLRRRRHEETGAFMHSLA